MKKWLKRGALPQQRTLNADDAKCWLEKQLRSYFTDDDALDAECALVDVFDIHDILSDSILLGKTNLDSCQAKRQINLICA